MHKEILKVEKMKNLIDKWVRGNNKKNLEKEMQMVLKHRTRCSILRIENKCKLKSTLLVKKKVKVKVQIWDSIPTTTLPMLHQ